MERRIFQRRFEDLSVGIREEISVFVTKLYSKDMISVDVRDRALNTTVDKGRRASDLLSALESRIRTDSSAFVAIVKILESIPALSHLAQSLQADYQHMKEVNVKSTELERRLLNGQLRSAQIQELPPPSRLETSKGTQQPFTSVLNDQPDIGGSDSVEPASATTEGQSESVLPQLRMPPGRSCTDPHFLLPPIPQSSESEQQLLRKFDQDFASVRELLMELIKNVGAYHAAAIIQQKSDEITELNDQIEQLKLSKSVHDAEKSHLQQQLHSAEEDVKGLTATICRLNKIMSQNEQELSDTKENLVESQEAQRRSQEELTEKRTKLGKLENTVEELKVKLYGADKKRRRSI